MRYRRTTTPGATYFFTVVTYQRQNLFHDTETIATLREAFHTVKLNHPFTIDAIVVLPNHLHCIWTLPPGDADFSTRWRLIKSTFSRHCPQRYKQVRDSSRLHKKEQAIWQRRFWEHQIRDERDFENHVNYIHYNPVHHRFVNRPNDWLYSSFHRYVEMGIYDVDWGSEGVILFEESFGVE
ncbi:MAG: transposase [Elainellaceae cyanobacterium]